MRKQYLTIALVLVTLLNQNLFAWGKLGHKTVAYIAQEKLKPKTLAKAKRILNGQDLVSVAVWADTIKFQRPETRGWHFIDVPVSDPSPDLANYCKGDNCITAKIDYFKEVLKSNQFTPDQKEEALKFVVHLVGDVFQPLHCAEDNHDKGGNGKQVRFEGLKMNLHSLWDSVIQKHDKGDERDLAALIEKECQASVVYDTIQDCALASHNIAATVIYPEHYRLNGVYDKDYEVKMQKIAHQQIYNAGVQLADILEDCLK